MMTKALNGANNSTPTTDDTHFAAAGRVVFQPAIMIGRGAMPASRIRVMSRAASMPANARVARNTARYMT